MAFIDADPGATSAAELVFKHAFMQWCIWHIYKNLRKNVKPRLDEGSYKEFSKAFAIAHLQISEGAFKAAYLSLLQRYPECAGYLNNELTHKLSIGRHASVVPSPPGVVQHIAEMYKTISLSDISVRTPCSTSC